jgi:trimeric autotransporter adhesin
MSRACKSRILGDLNMSVRVLARRTAAVLGILVAWPASSDSQTIREDFPLPNGIIHALTAADGTLYVGGSFTRIGSRASYGAALSPTTGEIVHLPKLDGPVWAAARDGGGGWFILGWFKHVDGEPRDGLAHIQADGTVASWNPQRGPNPLAIAVEGSSVYVGGHFTVMNGVTRMKAAALDAVTGALLPWDPHIEYVTSNNVEAIRVAGGRVYLGGDFYIGGQSRRNVAAVDPTTGALLPWGPIVNGPVFAIAVGESAVYLGGRFTAVDGQPRSNIAAVDIVTGHVTPWNPGADSDVWTLECSGSTLYAGGTFTSIAGAPRSSLAAFDLETGSLTSWNPGGSGLVMTISVAGSTVYAGGSFSTVGGQPRDNLVAIDSATGAPSGWDPGAHGAVYTLLTDEDRVFAGGDFAFIAGKKRRNLAAIDIATGGITDWNPGANGIVRALVAGEGPTLYAGGAFDSVGGQRRRQIAQIAGVTGTVSSWNPSSYGSVYSLALSGPTLYAGGNFTAIGGQPRSRIAALDVATGVATPWNPGADSFVRAIVPHGNVVFAGGSFQDIGGASRPCLAALDPVTGAATAWNSFVAGDNPDVYALAARGPHLYVGGDFTQIGGTPRANLAALDVVSGAATSWAPYALSTCYSLALAGVRPSGAPDIVYAGGAGVAAGAISALDGETAAPRNWYPPLYSAAYALGIDSPNVFAAGAFGLAAVTEAMPTLAAPPRAGFADHDLLHVRPVPSTGRTAISFVLPHECRVRLRVFDVQGRIEAELMDGVLGPGIRQVVWNGEGVRGKSPAGSYFVRFEADGRTHVRRIVLAR